MANEVDPKEGISLNDLRNTLKENTAPRVIVDGVTNHDNLISDIKWYPSSKTDRDEAEIIVSKPKAKHYQLGEGKTPSGFSTQIKSAQPCRAYVLFQILKDRYEEHEKRGTLQQYLKTQLKMQTASLGELMVMDILYGDRKVDVKGMKGLASYYNHLGNYLGGDLDYSTRTMDAFPTGVEKTGNNIANLRDIFAVTFGSEAVKPFYPTDSKTIGLNFGSEQMDKVNHPDPKNGGTVWYYEREITWQGGVHVVDAKKAGRLCNIPLDAALLARTGYDKELLSNLIRLTSMVKADNGEKTILYMDPMLWMEIKILLAKINWQNAVEEKHVDTLHTQSLFGREVRLNDSQKFAQQLVTAA